MASVKEECANAMSKDTIMFDLEMSGPDTPQYELLTSVPHPQMISHSGIFPMEYDHNMPSDRKPIMMEDPHPSTHTPIYQTLESKVTVTIDREIKPMAPVKQDYTLLDSKPMTSVAKCDINPKLEQTGPPRPVKKVVEVKSLYKCQLCKFLTKSADLMAKHLKKSHKKKLPRSIKRIEAKKKIKCVMTKDGFLKTSGGCECSKCLLPAGMDSLICPKCSYKAMNKTGLTLHMKTHMQSTYKCSRCDYYTGEIKQYIAHAKLTHTKKPMVHKCGTCTFKSKVWDEMLKHKKQYVH